MEKLTAFVETMFDQLRAELLRVQEERNQLQWLVTHDELTELPNRRHFYNLAPALLDGAVVMMMDLNKFKSINDSYGHRAGDAVIKEVGHRIDRTLHYGLVARLGGDEFAAVVPGARWPGAVSSLNQAMRPRIHLDLGKSVVIGLSIGVCDRQATLSERMRVADEAMYEAKRRGRVYSILH